MPFLAPLIAGAIGVGAIGAAVINVGLAVGLSYAATKLRPKQKSATAADQGGIRLGLRVDTNPPRQVIIGEAATSGSLVYWQLSGDDNKVLHMVFALADHECNSLQGVLVNGKEKSRDSGSGQIDGYGANLIVRFYSGASDQTADSELVSTSGGRWTSNDKGTGVCYAVAKMTYDEKLFPEGIPEFGFVVRGLKLFDPRTGTSAYSDNPTCAIYTVLRGISVGGEKLLGMNVPADAIRQSEAEAAANACDEAVARKAGGTEKRYRCGVVFDCTQSNRDIIETLLASMAGEVIEAGGIYRIIAGVAQTPVAQITDADLIVTEPLITRPRRSRNEIVNAIQGSFTDPTRAYNPVALPPRTSSDDEDEDGGIRLTRSLDLVAVTSRSQAQRILEVERRRARRMASASMKLRARWIGLEPGDWVTFSSDRRGYVEKTFVIQSKTGARDLTSDIVLVETDAGIDDWTASTDEIDDDQVIDLASAGPGLSSVSGIDLDTIIVEGATGQQRPGIIITWTPITDPTIVSLEMEYRKVGDTVALDRNISNPAAGSYTTVAGIQGGVTYEARLRPVARPDRATDWSSWVTSVNESDPQVVAVAAYAYGVDPAGLPPAILSAQDRFELDKVFQEEEVFGSVNERLSELWESFSQINEVVTGNIADAQGLGARIDETRTIAQTATLSLAQQITALSAQLEDDIAVAVETLTTRVETVEVVAGTKNRVFRQNTAPVALAVGDLWIHTGMSNRLYRATAVGSGSWELSEDTRIPALQTTTTALASSLSTLTTRVDGNEATAFDLSESIDGILARRVLGTDVNGRAALIDIAGNTISNSITFVGDTFYFAHPSVSGGAPVPIIAIRTVGGVPKFVFKGQLLVDAIISGEASFSTLSAIVANLGEVIAGVLRDAANTYRFEVALGRFRRTDNQYTIDMQNKIFEIIF